MDKQQSKKKYVFAKEIRVVKTIQKLHIFFEPRDSCECEFCPETGTFPNKSKAD